ncbi:uncharacterized protein LOC127867597 isoform X2 [Dreissena polymorpha]|uniref:Uncharacterized protein n=1 Tax=Dreissena polymorpha TaxID=45954 RepID=A0A9D4S7A3_DREPO|nr:uncharacterized protein LOC127867597 isoform X2 [Dreissena polymorpha]KAH3893143.1 hypothetical protein DPMN_017287 [Dreissena polymorpha]
MNLAWIAIIAVFCLIFVVAVVAVIIYCCAVRRRHSYLLIKTDNAHPYGSTGHTNVVITVTPASPRETDMCNHQSVGCVVIDEEPSSPDYNHPYPVGQVGPDAQSFYPAVQVDPYQNQDLHTYNPDSEPYTPQSDAAPYTPVEFEPYSANTEPYDDTAPYSGHHNNAGFI